MGIIKDFINRSILRGKGISLKDPTLAAIFSNMASTGKLTTPYRQLASVYACVRAIAVNIAQVPFEVYKKGSDVPDTGYMGDLFQNVNPNLSRSQLWEATVTLLGVQGEAATIISEEEINGIPLYLTPVSGQYMKKAYSGNTWVGWHYMVNGDTIFVPKERVIYPKYYNPSDITCGQSPLEAVRLSLDSEYGAIKYNQTFFDQGQAPGSIFSTDDQLSDAAYKRLKHELINSQRGSKYMHQSLLLDGGVKISNLRPSNRDLEFLELRKFTLAEICMIYKVPKSEIGIYEDTNYATAMSADIGFWKKTLLPIMRMVTDVYNTAFLNPKGYYGAFDIKQIDALNNEIIAKAEAAEKFFNVGFSRDEINETLGLGFNPTSPDVSRQEMSAGTQAGKTVDKSMLTALEPSGENTEYMLKMLRDQKWKSLTGQLLPVIGGLKKGVRQYFHEVEQKIYKIFVKAVKAPDIDSLKIEEAFSDGKLRAIIEPYIKDSIMLGVSVHMLPEKEIQHMITTRGLKITRINETTRAEV